MRRKIFATILLAGLSFGMVFSQTINKPKLDSLFNILAEKNKAMGSLIISKNGTVLYDKTIGYSFISGNEKKPATNITKYRIGSISKMFTATMIFQLIEEGKIKLSSTLDTYFPNIPNAKKITISNLLNHRSGLHNITDDPDFTTWMTQPKTRDEMLSIISKSKVDFQPDEKISYSNTNFIILGYIIEKISKQSYSNNLNERITSKIGLSNTYFGDKTNTNNDESFSYQFESYWKQLPETDMSIPGGAGSIVSTPTDLTKFIEALFAMKLISNTSLAQMKTITEGYGMGMFQLPFYTKMGYGHPGAIDGFTSSLLYFPEDSLALSYCSNGQVCLSSDVIDVISDVLSVYFNKDYSIPTFNAVTISLKTEDLDKYLGVYASAQMPFKFTISKDNTVLIAEVGQSSFPLEPTEKDKFKFAGLKMEFNTDKNEMTFKQDGVVVLFIKEK